MKVTDGATVLTGMAEVSVKEIIALEKSVTDKDQTIGALREQINSLNQKLEEIKKEQKVVVIRKTDSQQKLSYDRYGNSVWDTIPAKDEIIEYRNFETVIEDLRKDEAKRLGIEITDLESKIKDLDFKSRGLEKDLDMAKKEKEDEIARAKDKIRKHMSDIIEGLNEEIVDLNDKLKKLTEDKTDEAVEEARKQEIIDLKERIHELETTNLEKPNFGWFKMMIYNWLKIDARSKIQAEREEIAKKERIDKISNNYPKNKNWWAPDWLFASGDSWNW